MNTQIVNALIYETTSAWRSEFRLKFLSMKHWGNIFSLVTAVDVHRLTDCMLTLVHYPVLLYS